MQSAKYEPMNKSELARALELASDQRSLMRNTLRKMEDKGEIVYGKKGRYSLRALKSGRLVGEIKFLKKGGALFFPDPDDTTNIEAGLNLDKYKKVFIPSRNSLVALDGDRVLIQVVNQPPPRWQKNSKQQGGKRSNQHQDDTVGKVVQIIERKTSSFIGLYNKRGKFEYVQPEDGIVVVNLLEWKNERDTPLCEIIEVVGWPDDPGVDIMAVIHKYRLRQEFSEEVKEEALKAHAEGISDEELSRREDWRGRNV